jgi:hypothetical protein
MVGDLVATTEAGFRSTVSIMRYALVLSSPSLKTISALRPPSAFWNIWFDAWQIAS